MKGLSAATFAKLVAFVVVMLLLSAVLFAVFGQYQFGQHAKYSAVFADVSRLEAGNSVRVAGIRVGAVNDVQLRSDASVLVSFDVEAGVAVTSGTTAAVRYLNVEGDRYLELVDGPGSTRILSPGSQIPVERTTPALDLDLLLGGLKPVIRGLNPQDVNALTSALIQIFQGEGPTLSSLFSETTSFSNTLADNDETNHRLIDNLNTVTATIARDGGKFSTAIDQLEQFLTGLSRDRDSIGSAIESLSAGTASVSDLLNEARSPLSGSIEQLNRLAPLLDDDKDLISAALRRAPENYRKLVRLGAYGSFINYYLCGLTVRVSDLQGRTAEFPWIKQESGRCAEP